MSPDYPLELHKTGLSVVFIVSGFLVTAVMVVVVKETMPYDSPPLPDQILDILPGKGLTRDALYQK